MTDEVLEDTMWEDVRPWAEQWTLATLKVNESKVEEKEWKELDDEDRQTRFLETQTGRVRSQ